MPRDEEEEGLKEDIDDDIEDFFVVVGGGGRDGKAGNMVQQRVAGRTDRRRRTDRTT